jgi:hypothetical protein
VQRPAAADFIRESDSDLPVFLRSHAIADTKFAHAIASMRLSLSGNPGRAAGEDIQAPGLHAQQRNRHCDTRTKLDDLLFAEAAFA